MSHFHNDQPITGETGSEDFLNRTTLANQLAKTVVQDEGDDCLTVSLEGPWGYGKTSVINLIKAQVSKIADNCIVVEFNPWLSGDNKSLIQDFLLQFSAQIGIKDPSEAAGKAAKELVSYSSLFSVAKLIPGTEPWASIIEGVFKQTGKSIDRIAKLKDLSLIDRKNDVSDRLSRINRPIIVVIDDIDRLTPAEAFQVLRLVKAVADFPRTTFLLAYDPSYLTTTLSQNGIDNTSEYLDKIVQLRVPLPLISYEGMEEIAKLELERLIKEADIELYEKDGERLRWLYQNYFRRLIRNPRELKRFFNHFEFVFSQIKGEVCVSDLFALSLVAIRSGYIYEDIKSNPEAYIGEPLYNFPARLRSKEERIEEKEKHRENLVNKLSPGDREFIIKLLEEIFPDLNSEGFALYRASDPDRLGRVAAPERLYTALHYKTPKTFVSDQFVIDFLALAEKTAADLEDVISGDKLERFMTLMVTHASSSTDPGALNARIVAESVVATGYLNRYFPESSGFLGFDIFRSLFWYSEKVFDSTPEKLEYLQSLSDSVYATPILVHFFYSHCKANEREGSHFPWLEDLKTWCINNSEKSLRQSLFAVSEVEPMLFNFLFHHDKEVLKGLLDDILTEEQGMMKLAGFFSITGSDSTNGPYISIDINAYSELWDPEEIQRRAKENIAPEMPAYTRATLLSMSDGSKRYLKDASKGENW